MGPLFCLSWLSNSTYLYDPDLWPVFSFGFTVYYQLPEQLGESLEQKNKLPFRHIQSYNSGVGTSQSHTINVRGREIVNKIEVLLHKILLTYTTWDTMSWVHCLATKAKSRFLRVCIQRASFFWLQCSLLEVVLGPAPISCDGCHLDLTMWWSQVAAAHNCELFRGLRIYFKLEYLQIM